MSQKSDICVGVKSAGIYIIFLKFAWILNNDTLIYSAFVI